MIPERLAAIVTRDDTHMTVPYAARVLAALSDAGFAITKKRRLGKWEFKIYFDNELLAGATGFTNPAGAWSFVRDEFQNHCLTLQDMKQMGYSVRRVKKAGI